MIFRLAFALLFIIFSVKAEIYSLWPKGKNGAVNVIPGEESDSLIEPVEVNGVPLKLHIKRINLLPDEFLIWLKNNFKPEQLEVHGDFIRIKGEPNDGYVTRLLIIPNPKGDFLTAFTMRIPYTLPPPQWPSNLPDLPQGSKLKYILKFSKRNGVFGEFTVLPGESNQKLREYAAKLRSLNWQAVAAEHRRGINGNGDLFIRSKPEYAILWINFHSEGQGFIFCR